MDEGLTILMDEHQNILEIISFLLKECDALENGKTIDTDFFNESIHFIINYADKFHHAKEEDILFVELNKENVQMHCNPTEQMLYEHGLGRDFVKQLKEGIAKNDKNKIINSARGYAHLLREHIYKEDNMLYPIADQVLSPKTKKDMLKKFVEIEQNFTEEKNKQLLFIKKLAEKKK